MLKPLFDVTMLLEKKGYSVTHSQDPKSGHELIQASLSPGDIPFMTFSYDKSITTLIVNVELQFPDTFAIAEITLECMNMYKTKMGKAFLIIPVDDGPDKYDVLYDQAAYDYIANQLAQDEQQQDFEQDSEYFVSKNKTKTTKGSVH